MTLTMVCILLLTSSAIPLFSTTESKQLHGVEQLDTVIKENRRIYEERMSAADEQKKNDTVCYDGTPCGWYIRDSYFIANTCSCLDDTYMCVRTGEDVDMGAYVYHCRQNKTIDGMDK